MQRGRCWRVNSPLEDSVTAGEYFALANRLPTGGLRELTKDQPFIVLAPHPDDESLGTGGLIALARSRGQSVSVVLLTNGSKSHPNSKKYPRDRLISLRRSELNEAAEILGLPSGSLLELGLPDAAAPTSGPEFEKALDAVAELIVSSGARSVFVTWRYDPHCDHQAAAHLGMELRARHPSLELWFYPIWGWHLPPSDSVPAPPPEGFRLAIDEVLSLKRAAIAAHVSQMTDLIDDDPDGFRFTPEALAPFLGSCEYFIRAPFR